MFLSNQTSFLTIVRLGFIIRICENDMARHEVILQQRLEIFLACRAEQECINLSRQFCECLVRRRKKGTANLGG